MKLFNDIKSRLFNERFLFYYFLGVLIIPNICLCFTEPLSLAAKLINILLPLSCYYVVMTFSRNSGKMLWILFPFVFLGAFQLVLLYLFGRSIIAVDMFLNLLTTNSTEAMELLDKLLPAIIIVVLLYVPPLVLAIVAIVRRSELSPSFLNRKRKKGLIALVGSLLLLAGTSVVDQHYDPKIDLYPVNVCYNASLAFQRHLKTEHYRQTSQQFIFSAQSSHPIEEKEIYVMVIGETSRAANWRLYGYHRATNPKLVERKGVISFSHVLTESNTTHKSVPMLMSSVSAVDFDSIYNRKSIITAFKEAGFHTLFFSNQRYNHSFIDFFGQEADHSVFIKESVDHKGADLSDDALLELVSRELRSDRKKLFIVLHTYGSHFNYKERYPTESAYFKPDFPVDAKVQYRSNLINAYDNSTRYTDDFLDRLMTLVARQKASSAILYTSDHGEDIFDDDRQLFLHASPVPSYFQIHVPFLLWLSQEYRVRYPSIEKIARAHSAKQISSSCSFFHTLLELGGVQTSCRNDSCSVVSDQFVERPRLYLNDHNRACRLEESGLEKPDFDRLNKMGVRYLP